MAALDGGTFDCVVLHLEELALPADLVSALRSTRAPVIVLAAGHLDAEQERQLDQLGGGDRVLRIARSNAELVDSVALVLHRSVDALPDATQAALQQLRRAEPVLAGRKMVVIDDDVRNIFSLTSALEEHGVELHFAESGRSGIELLRRMPDTDIALVDIMMPGMDGYQTIREIRSIPELDSMPIVAVTAKAMKGDRQKCIDAGASDYVAKPVDMDQLVSVLRVWLHRSDQGLKLRPSSADNSAADPEGAGGQA